MGGCARPIRGVRVNRLRSNATKRPIRGRELIKVRDLFKEIRYIYICNSTLLYNSNIVNIDVRNLWLGASCGHILVGACLLHSTPLGLTGLLVVALLRSMNVHVSNIEICVCVYFKYDDHISEITFQKTSSKSCQKDVVFLGGVLCPLLKIVVPQKVSVFLILIPPNVFSYKIAVKGRGRNDVG